MKCWVLGNSGLGGDENSQVEVRVSVGFLLFGGMGYDDKGYGSFAIRVQLDLSRLFVMDWVSRFGFRGSTGDSNFRTKLQQ